MSKKTKPTTSTLPVQPAAETATVFEKLYFWFFLVLPVVYSTKTVDPVLAPRQMLLSVFVLIIGITILSKVSAKKLDGDFSFLRLNIYKISGLFLLTILISFFQANVLSESAYVFSKLLIELLFFLLTAFLFVRRQLRIKSLVKSLVGMGTIILLIALYQLFTLDLAIDDFSTNAYNIKSSAAHKNLFASLLFLIFPFLFIAATARNGLRTASIVLLITGGIILWVIQSRAVLIALVISVLVYLIFALRHRLFAFSPKAAKTTLIVGAIAVVSVVFITYKFKDTFSHLFYSESIYERIGLWQNTNAIIAEHPVTGVGAGNWQIWFPKNGLDKFGVDRVKDGMTTFQRPHNDFLWVFSETGIFGILTYVLLFGCILFYLVKLLRKSEDPADKRRYLILFSAVTGYLIIAALDFPLERMEHQVVLYLIFAIAAGSYYLKFGNPETKRATKIPVYLALTGAVFSLVVAFQRTSGERHMQQLYGAHQTGNWNEMILQADLATNTFYEMDPTSVPIAWYKGVALFSLNDISGAQRQFEQAEKVHPYNIHVMNNLGSCYEKQGQHAKAIRYYKQALHYSSGFEEPRLNLSAVYFNMKQYEQAFQTIDRCNTNSTDPKYKTFLPAILAKKIELLQAEQKAHPGLYNKLEALKNNPDRLRKTYHASKIMRVKFDEFVLQPN